MVYAFVASVLPIQTLLQPRDFINSHQLFLALLLFLVGVVRTHPAVVAPAVRLSPPGAPPMIPFLFVVVACGAISGFHCLVSSGTSSKQCRSDCDTQFIAYGGMLMESGLSILVVIACVAGIGMGFREGGSITSGLEAFNVHYATWQAAEGLGSKLGAFVQGAANIIGGMGIPQTVSLTIMAVFIVSFAATTLDTATRIQSYIVVELAKATKLGPLSKNVPATLFAVGTALPLAFYDGSGKGALRLWPLWGTINQLLAGLALLAVTACLARRKVRLVYTAFPMAFMLAFTGWAMILGIRKYYENYDWLLLSIGSLVMALNLWLVAEGLLVLGRVVSEKKRA